MILYPAIDVLGGKAVRLEQGDFGRRREYADDPLDAARRWVAEGATHLHFVDLDGARDGRPVNTAHLQRIVAELGARTDLIQCGGGLRTRADVEATFAAGAGRVVIGTAAFADPDMLAELVSAHGERIAVGVDVRDGRVAVEGWVRKTALEPREAVQTLTEFGVSTIVYTNVDRDGTLEGVFESAIADVSSAAGDRRVLCSGGIGSLEDLRALASLGLPNLEGVIVGKALYEGRFNVAEAQAALRGEPAATSGAEGQP
jgi:phosphoribosylformimino-5-aminoimidazole carboxamide ribotide isomerase